MSTFAGITFAEQNVSPSDDAIIRRAILPDGILTGCSLSYSGYTLTMGAGFLLACGRQFRHPLAQNWPVSDATSGFARLVLTIDLTRTATETAFDQIVDAIEYASAEDGFAELVQTDINQAGTKYQIEVCKVSLGAGGITGIVSQLPLSRVDGASLNFKVVGGLTQPSGPAENTIWVSTNASITSWQFSGTEPAEPAEGLVWFATGKASTAAFNALKKNAVMVYPLYAKQFVSGQWVGVKAQIYMDGDWRSLFSGLIYEAGAFYTEHAAYLVPETAPVEETASAIVLSTVKAKNSEVYKVFGPVPLDDISTLAMTSAFTDSVTGAHRRVLYVAASANVGRSGAAKIKEESVSSKWTESAVTSLDVSDLTGEYYVYAGTNTDGSAWDNSRVISITKLTGADEAAAVSLEELEGAFREGVNSV
jgi:hypothetical protein